MADGLLIRKIPWTRQPQIPTAIDTASPLTNKLRYLWSTVSGGLVVESVTPSRFRSGSFGTTSSTGANKNGLAVKSDGASTSLITLPSAVVPYPTPGSGALFTFIATVYFNSIAGTQRFYSSGFNNSLSFYITATGALGLATRYGTVIGTSTGTLSTKTWYNVAVSWDGTTATFYIDGVASGTGTTVPGSYSLTGSYYLLGDTDGDRVRTGGMLQMFGIYDRVVPADELFKISNNPWQLFQPQVRRLYVTSAAASGFKPCWAMQSNQIIQSGVQL